LTGNVSTGRDNRAEVLSGFSSGERAFKTVSTGFLKVEAHTGPKG